MGFINVLLQFGKDIFSDRQMLIELARKDVRRRFSGTYFGLAWCLFQPLITIVVYWAVFQFGFRSGDVGNTPFVLWFISGIIIWLFASEAFSNASNCLLEYNYLIQKVKFNVNILPLVKIFSSFIIHLIFMVLAIIICTAFGYYPRLMILQLIYYTFATVLFVFSISLITSSIMVFFRDLGQMIGIVLLIGMWGTPIAWDLSIFPESIHFVFKLNPIYYLVEGYRDALLARKWFWERPVLGLYFWLVTFCLLCIGGIVFTRLKPHFADSV